MDNNKLNRIFAESDCISNQMMENYLDGKLLGKDKNQVEVHLETCELCKDEFEGLKSMKDKNRLSDIVFHLNQKITKKSHSKRKILLFPNVSSMAAIILLLVGFVWLFFYIIYISPNSLKQKQVAQSIEEKPNKENIILNENETSKNQNTRIIEKESSGFKGHIELKDELKSDKDLIVAGDSIIRGNVETGKEEIKSTDKVLMDEAVTLSDFEEVNDIRKMEEKVDDITAVSESNIADSKNIKDDNDKNRSNSAKKNKSIAEENTLSTYDIARSEFDKQNYKKAIDLFLKVKEDETNKEEIYYYLAQSYQNIDNQKKAITYYDKLISLPKSKYYENALWNKSQVQIKAGQKPEAIQNLNLIISNKGQLSNQALQQVDSLKNK